MVFKEHIGKQHIKDRETALSSLMNDLWSTGSWVNPESLEKSKNYFHIKKYLPHPQSVLLEAGCGLGQWVRFLTDKGYEIYGIDISEIAINEGKKNWNDLKLIKGDLNYLPFPKNSIDVIISFGAIEHDINGPENALAEMLRVLKINGILYCTVPCMNYIRRVGLMQFNEYVKCNRIVRKLMKKNPEYIFFEYVYTPKEYVKILENVGFKIIQLVPLDFSKRLTGKPGNIYNKFAKIIRDRILTPIHRKFPWAMTHMMAAICEKSNN